MNLLQRFLGRGEPNAAERAGSPPADRVRVEGLAKPIETEDAAVSNDTVGHLAGDPEFVSLARFVDWSDGFGLAVCRINHPALTLELVTALRAAVPAKPIAVVALVSGTDPLQQIADAVGPHAAAVVVTGLENMVSVGDDERGGLHALNLDRDSLSRRFGVPFVFVAPDYALAELATHAPDLWSVRSDMFWFTGNDEQVGETLGSVGSSWNMPLRDQLAEERHLENLVDELRLNDAEPAALAGALFGLGQMRVRRSDFTSAREMLAEALPLYRRVGDVLGEANCLRNLGDVEFLESNNQIARDLFNQALPLYRRVGDVLGEANTLESIGQLQMSAGDLRAAVAAFHRAGELYERVGQRAWAEKCRAKERDLATKRAEPPPA